MENRNLQRQAKEQQRKKEICYQCQGRAQEAVSPKDTVFQ